uniref:Transgelin n=1 Tax=Parascaris univalens TaxID=6257 RepID=A0A915BCD4_PARUN
MANHGPSYGLSRELERKNQARFSIEEAQEVLLWIEQVTNVQFDKDPTTFETAQDVADALKDGVQLCDLMCRLVNDANALAYNRRPKMPFHKMENISNFLEAIKAYGVPEISCFQTVDLYENKQCYKVIECLRALAAVAQSKNAPVIFPSWVVKLSQGRPRTFPESVMRRGEMVIPLQYGTNKCASQKGMTPYGLARQIKPEN